MGIIFIKEKGRENHIKTDNICCVTLWDYGDTASDAYQVSIDIDGVDEEIRYEFNRIKYGEECHHQASIFRNKIVQIWLDNEIGTIDLTTTI